MAVVGVRDRLQAGLIAAMKSRDPVAVKALRSALAAIANAEAVTDTGAPRPGHGSFAGSVKGLGAGDVPRRTLSEFDMREIVADEIDDRIESARQYDTLGETLASSELCAEARVLRSYLEW